MLKEFDERTGGKSLNAAAEFAGNVSEKT